MKPVADRLMAGIVKVESGCWVWMKASFWAGYGAIRINGTTKRAHRVSYETFVGPIPADMSVLHRCDRRTCINPDHLFLGTQVENLQDMRDKGRQNHSGLNQYRKPS